MPEPKQEIVEVKENSLPATASDQATAMLQMIREVATAPNVNVEAIRAMLDMQRQLTKDQAERAFNEGLAKLATRLPHIKKGGKIPLPTKDGVVRNVAFAKLENIDTVIRPLLVEEGFSLSFDTQQRPGDGGGLVIIGTLSHVQGHSRTSSMPLPLDAGPGRNNLQANGSTMSYGRRYLTCMMLNIIAENEDDDGNSSDPISIEEAAAIDAKLNETGSNKKAFLALFGVDEVPKIQQRDYKKAIALLAAKASDKAAAKKAV